MKNNFFKHLRLITKHRHQVFVLCCKCGLFWRGLVHDISKFSWVEFSEGVKYFNGKHSPISECRKQNGYSLAWLHHKGRNKHHFEYWYDEQNKVQMNIPYKYAVENVCDHIAASKCYNGKDYSPKLVLEYWQKTKNYVSTNNTMKTFFDKVFFDFAENGEKYILNKKYMKKTYNDIVTNSNIFD